MKKKKKEKNGYHLCSFLISRSVNLVNSTQTMQFISSILPQKAQPGSFTDDIGSLAAHADKDRCGNEFCSQIPSICIPC
jgi:hypothetical protein